MGATAIGVIGEKKTEPRRKWAQRGGILGPGGTGAKSKVTTWQGTASQGNKRLLKRSTHEPGPTRDVIFLGGRAGRVVLSRFTTLF